MQSYTSSEVSRCTQCPPGNNVHPVSAFSIKAKTGRPYAACKKCTSDKRKRYMEKLKTDPVKYEEYRLRQKAYIAEWDKRNKDKRSEINKRFREAHLEELRAKERLAAREYKKKYPEKVKAYTKLRFERIKSDPVLYQRHLENTRIDRRLKKEREEGKALTDYRNQRVIHKVDPYVLVDVEPLRKYLKRLLADGKLLGEVAQAAGMDASKLGHIHRGGSYDRVALGTVDKVLTSMNGPPVQSLYPDA